LALSALHSLLKLKLSSRAALKFKAAHAANTLLNQVETDVRTKHDAGGLISYG
jgi:hypothetical protein